MTNSNYYDIEAVAVASILTIASSSTLISPGIVRTQPKLPQPTNEAIMEATPTEQCVSNCN